MNEKPLRFSFSSTSAYETCPHRYNQVNRLKNFDEGEPHPNATRGSAIHEEMEYCLKEDRDPVGDYDGFPAAHYPDYQWVIDTFRAETGLKMAEMPLAIDRAWRPCGFYDPTVWYCAIIDVSIINGTHLTCFDIKCGKHRLKPRQANDGALIAMLHYPFIETVDFHFLWTDADVPVDTFQYDRARDGEVMMQTMLDIPTQISESVKTDKWDQHKSGLCGFCPVVDCKHWKPRRVT